ncbi:MAG: hypoxanthine-guanine phosphoribosyltransferase [Methylococcales bacterium]|jgi:hypoxanthine phosphoribosyltransferase|nr:hypoxanthine-guanine phosphoribosyltransferase [Methylococcales bacterium]MBT7410836.1 hypoxanthine-guanine phosphoribosyltransferase [Methylococcales bacterium]
MTSDKKTLCEEAKIVYQEADCLFSKQQVEDAMDVMAVSITEKLVNVNPVSMCVMNGAIIPAGCLLNRLDFPMEVDYLHATRYQDKFRGGKLEWIRHHSVSIKDRVVLLIDDILDEGVTLKCIKEYCEAEGAKKVYIAVLANKLHDRKVDIQAEFVGFDVEDRYLFGYGMDYKGYLRNAPGIFAVKGL